MDAVPVFQWVVLILSMTTGIGVPVLLFMASRHDKMLERQNEKREEKFVDLGVRLTHLDDCVDSVKTIVLGQVVTKSEMIIFRAEVTEIITRMRIAISNDTNGLHERLLRLEKPYFTREAGDV